MGNMVGTIAEYSKSNDVDGIKELVPAIIRKGLENINMTMFDEETKTKLLDAVGEEMFRKGMVKDAMKVLSMTGNKKKL